jgi:hypothetical protein
LGKLAGNTCLSPLLQWLELRFPTFQSSGAKDEMRVSYGRMQGLPAHLQGQTKPGVFLSAPRLWLETATSTIPVSSRGPHDALIPKMPPTWQGGYHPDPFSVIRGRMEREGTRTALGLNHQEERQIGVGEQSVRACPCVCRQTGKSCGKACVPGCQMAGGAHQRSA